jgi:hypothetical protein
MHSSGWVSDAGDELLVDRALEARPGRVLVVRPRGRTSGWAGSNVIGGVAVLVTDLEEIPLTADVEPWGVATVLLHHLPLGPAGERERRNVAR